MTTKQLTITGEIDSAFQAAVLPVIDTFTDDNAQLAVFIGDAAMVDIAIGTSIDRDSLMVPFSVSKNAIGVSIALLVERRLLDLDLPVAHYWPEFAAAGKQNVTVRQLLSHQAGLPQTVPAISHATMNDDEDAAAAFAAQRPLWHPGSTFGYHGLSIGVLASELVRRITGVGLQDFFEREVREPRGLDFYLGLPEALESRVVRLEPLRRGLDDTVFEVPFPRHPGQIATHGGGNVTTHFTDEGTALAREDRAIGLPSAFGTVSARGVATLLAEAAVGVRGSALLSPDTIAQVSQTQVVGEDEMLGIPRRYGVVFQKPSGPRLEFGGFRAFGHDGLAGALGFHDPETQISFGFTIRRGMLPGGADQRAIEIAQRLRQTVLA